jgi:predicted nucleic acid-binding protein
LKILIDTNVILDAVAAREPWNTEAEQIFLLAANNMVEAFITASSATDIYYLIRKHLHNHEEAKKVMLKLYDLFGVLDVNQSDCTNALHSGIKDYEDAVVDQSAFRNGMEYIVTRNISDYEQAKVEVISSKTLIDMVQSPDF